MKHISPIMGFVTIFLFICMAKLGSSARHNSKVYDVLHFGAVGDGVHDDSKAFLAAWTAACGTGSGATTLTIPGGRTYLLSPLKFEGPCKSSSINFQVIGTLVAVDFKSWPHQESLRWIVFSQVDGLVVDGNGVFDGRGSEWWAMYGKQTQKRPTALTFDSCKNLRLQNLKHKDPARNHISISDSVGVSITNLIITAPEDSPNTDGIDIAKSTNVNINACVIATGDDCVAINGGTANIFITNVACGPGHGISIGSLGENGAMDTVEDIQVKSCSFHGTKNGARIKTWQGGQGYAKHISFTNITLTEANFPITINQFYCDNHSSAPCKNLAKAVRITDVVFDGIHGTVASDEAIELRCSETYGCSEIVLNDINIRKVNADNYASVLCTNAHGRSTQTIPAVECLLP